MKYGAEVKASGHGGPQLHRVFPTEFEAFKAFADTYPESVSLLLDTYNIMESGLPNLIKLDDYLIEKYPDDPNKRVKSRPHRLGRPWPAAPSGCARPWTRPASPISSWWPPTPWTKRKSPTWSCMSTPTSIPTAWARTSSPRLPTRCSAACTSWWRSSRTNGTYQPKMKISDSVSKAIIPGQEDALASVRRPTARPSATSSPWTAR